MVLLAGWVATAVALLPSCNVSLINVTHGSTCGEGPFRCEAGPESLRSMSVREGCGGFFLCDGYVTECVSYKHSVTVTCPCGPLPPPRPAGQFYVDLNAAPGGDGSEGKPFKTIQDCVSIAAYTSPNTSTSTCNVKAGVYREDVEIPPAGSVQVVGEGPGKTILDGTERIGAVFSKYDSGDPNKHIWVATLTDSDPTEIGQLFINVEGVTDGNEHLTEARWPNAKPSTELSASTLAKMGPLSQGGQPYSSIVDPNLVNGSNAGINWTGARVFFRVFSGEETFTSKVLNVSGPGGQNLTFPSPNCAFKGGKFWAATGQYYVAGILAALDAPGEWVYDSSERKLYVWMPGGVEYPSNPSGSVYVKVKDYCMHTVGISTVQGDNFKISQLSFSACTLYMQCNGCEISDVNLMYPTYSPWISYRMPGSDYMPPVTFLSGDNNTVTRTNLQHTNNWGWYISGSNLLFEDNYIGDTNWYGTLDFVALRIGFTTHNPCTGGWQPPPPKNRTAMGGRTMTPLKPPAAPARTELVPAKTPSLKVPQGMRNVIRRTTIRGSGNDGIATSQLSNEVSLCHLSFTGLIGGDSAALHADNTNSYCDSHNCSKHWHHNWVHNSREKCIRCDDNSRNCTIYNNVVFNCGMPATNGAPSGILIKGKNNLVAHNTVFNVSGQGGFTPETGGGDENANLEYWDNYFCTLKEKGKPDHGFPFNESNIENVTLWQTCLEDPANYKFQPRASCTELVGKGVQHRGFDAANPDIGPYAHTGARTSMVILYGDDYNTTDWRPGCTFHPDCFIRDNTWDEWPPSSVGH